MRTTCLLALLLSVVLTNAARAQESPVAHVVDSYIETSGHEMLRSLRELVAMPNVSENQEDVRVNADFLVDQFEARGARMELLEIPGANPTVYGELLTPGADRTLMIYIHYDGQPVDPARWRATEPFVPALFSDALENGGALIDWPEDGDEIDPGWRMYARSTSDDKAPIVALLAALDAINEAGIPLTSNIKFFFDGEEEIGSPNMRKTLDLYVDKFEDVDLWLFCDGPLHQSRKPCVYFGVRGITGFELTVYGATRNLHSGHYGNWAPNPGMRLAQLLASMKDGSGNVMIEGFYDTVTPLSESEVAELAAVPQIDESLREELGLLESEAPEQNYLQRMQLPSLNIKGIRCGAVGSRARNIVPNEATVAIDIRLVKGNVPRDMIQLVRDHIRSQGYTILDDEPTMQERRESGKLIRMQTSATGYPAARTAMDNPQVEPVVEQLQIILGDEELLKIPGLGGSLPLYLISDYLQQPLMIVPLANHDNNQHSPDENLRIGNLFYGVKAMAAILTAPPVE
ncbi:MAG: M20/M25/M40 family metallo-hydrolase [Planctomycetota bacterium]